MYDENGSDYHAAAEDLGPFDIFADHEECQRGGHDRLKGGEDAGYAGLQVAQAGSVEVEGTDCGEEGHGRKKEPSARAGHGEEGVEATFTEEGDDEQAESANGVDVEAHDAYGVAATKGELAKDAVEGVSEAGAEAAEYAEPVQL